MHDNGIGHTVGKPWLQQGGQTETSGALRKHSLLQQNIRADSGQPPFMAKTPASHLPERTIGSVAAQRDPMSAWNSRAAEIGIARLQRGCQRSALTYKELA
mmetsp:Transcript_101776/g.202091  ORF Transcript_101776/g.202091 Transcript_101776/m.202091 type:complete len:101 (+) Transcript_101776:536-838(+)